MRLIAIISTLVLTLSMKGNEELVKIITPGEHLGYQFESFDLNNKSIEATVSQGETWAAVYIENGNFKTKSEKIHWDTTQNFTILSDTSKQPYFYVQGMNNLLEKGSGTEFTWNEIQTRKPLTWTFNHSNYTILYSEDKNTPKILSYKEGTINTDIELTLFKGINPKHLSNFLLEEKNIVRLHWTGDLNGDNEPDFLIAANSHHETIIIDLILSEKADQEVKWRRVARFTEWS